jgi:type VI secretion system protein ImpE
MTADEHIEAGHVNLAIEALSETLRRDPKQLSARVSLFTLLGLSGQWDRALRQLDAFATFVGNQPSNLDPARCRELVEAERARQRYFDGGPPPQTLAEPGPATVLAWEVQTLVGQNEPGKARDLLQRFEDEKPLARGWLGGQAFEGFRDASDVTGLVLELLAPGGYFWVEWDDVMTLDVLPPQSLLDLLWAQARIHTKTGMIGAVVLPGLYPNSWKHADEAVRLGRRNEWIDLGEGLIQGAGAKVYDVGGEFKALLELQDLAFDKLTDLEPPGELP